MVSSHEIGYMSLPNLLCCRGTGDGPLFCVVFCGGDPNGSATRNGRLGVDWDAAREGGVV